MADIIKNSYAETNLHTKVVFQRGRDVSDFELNEAQDITRIFGFRSFYAGVQNEALNPGVNDDSWKIVENTSTSNQVLCYARSTAPRTGYMFCDGIPLFLEAPDEVVTGDTVSYGIGSYIPFETPAGNRVDKLHLMLYEEEIDDPNAVPSLGATSKRRRIVRKWIVERVGIDPAPTSSSDPIWEGGTRYFLVASIARHTGVPSILTADITDERHLLPAAVFNQWIVGATEQPMLFDVPSDSDGTSRTVTGHNNADWCVTVGDGTNTFGDFNGAYAIQQALTFFRDYSTDTNSCRIRVKPGTYSFDASHRADMTARAFVDLTIEGAGQELCTISFSYSGGSYPLVLGNSNLSMSGLTMSAVSSANPVFAFKEYGTIRLKELSCASTTFYIRDLVTMRCPVTSKDTTGALVEDCVFVGGQLLFNTFNKLSVTGGTRANAYINRCTFCRLNSSSIDPIRLLNSGSASADAVFPSLFIRDCTFYLGDDAAIFDIDQFQSSYIDDIIVENCNITGKKCIYSLYTYGSHAFYISRFLMRNSTFTTGSADDATHPAFYLGSTINSKTDVSSVTDVTLENVNFVGQRNYFSTTARAAIDPTNVYTNKEWCNLTFNSLNVTLRNVSVYGYATESVHGDVAVLNSSNIDIDGLKVYVSKPLVGGVVDYPRHRILLCPTQALATSPTIRSARNVSFSSTTNDVIHDWGSAYNAIIRIAPYGDFTISDSRITLSDHASGAVAATTGISSFDRGLTPSTVDGLKVANCTFTLLGNRSFIGIAHLDDGVHTSDKCRSITVKDNKFLGPYDSNYAVYIDKDTHSVDVSGNYVEWDTSEDSADSAIHVVMSLDDYLVSFRGNDIRFPSGTTQTTGIYYYTGDTLASGRSCAFGNSVSKSADGTPGYIKLGELPAGSLGLRSPKYAGYETHVTVDAGTHAVTYEYGDGGTMIHNFALLDVP